MNYGGVYTSEIQFLTRWREQNVHVDALIVGEGSSSEVYRKYVDKYHLLPEFPVIGSRRKLISILNNLLARYLYVRKIKFNNITGPYDAIIYRNAIFETLAHKVGLESGSPVYWHMPQSMRSFAEKSYYRYSLSRKKIIPIGNSRYTSDSIGLDISKGHIYPGYDPKRTANHKTHHELRAELGISETAIVFGIAARIKENKAQDKVIEAVNRLVADGADIHLIISGGPLDSNYAKYCQKLASRSPGRIHFTGHLDNIVSFYNTIQYYVNSRTDAEPFGISIAESLGSGIPVIAVRKGGPIEMIEHGTNGWLIDQSTVGSYENAISEALRNHSDYGRMSAIAKESIRRFEASINADAFLALIKSRP